MQKRPNILFILADDQGPWALGAAGNREIHTPNLDGLAERGVRFDHFFCASPVCSPARASILTGKIPSAHGVHDWIRGGNLDREALGSMKNDPYYYSETIPAQYLENQTTYTDLLAEAGYTCALSGKWHLGDSLTPQHGFSKWFTIGRGGCFYYKADLVEDGKVWFEKRYITDVITDKALDFLEDLSAQENPFYLSVHYTAPHSPWEERDHPEKYVELYRDCPFLSVPELPRHPWSQPTAPYGEGNRRKTLLRGYYAAITAMDANIGRLLRRLAELGLDENTLVIFTSDNGMSMGHHGVWGKGNGTYPFNMFDSTVMVPFLLSYPAKIPGGRVVSEMYSHYDVLPTLLDLAGVEKRPAGNLPGRSFAPVLTGESVQPEVPVCVLDEYGASRMIRTKDWKYIKRYPNGPDELYDLKNDPEEAENRLFDVPEKLVVKMGWDLEDWFYAYSLPSMDGRAVGATGFGQLWKMGDQEKPVTFYHPE